MIKKTIKVTLFFGIPWIIIMTLVGSLIKGSFTIESLLRTSITGLLAGLSFSIIINYLTNRLYKKTTIEIEPEEKLIKEAAANHFKGKEGVGGKLVLTDQRLIFKSHVVNIQNHQESFDLPRVKRVEAVKTLGILLNGIKVELDTTETHKFIVDEPGEWVTDILNQQKLHAEPRS